MKKQLLLIVIGVFFFGPLSAFEMNRFGITDNFKENQTYLYELGATEKQDASSNESSQLEQNIEPLSLVPGSIPEYIDHLDFFSFRSDLKYACTKDSCSLDHSSCGACSAASCSCNCESECNHSCQDCNNGCNDCMTDQCSAESECETDLCYDETDCCCCCCCEEEEYGYGFGSGGGIGGGAGVGIGAGIGSTGGGSGIDNGNDDNGNENTNTGTDTSVIVPEPSTYATLGLCLVIALYLARRRVKQARIK